MTRRCSHCSNNGHNSRTCPMRAGGVRLFGVRLTEGGSMKKSASMGCLSHYASLSASPKNALDSPPPDPLRDSAPDAAGYASDDPNHASCSANRRGERKKGTPWTEEEHRMFLVGLQKLGKGDWRGIARNYVVSRTPTQVASHAQKYFIRQTNASRRKRRSSLFDMIPDMPMDQVPVAEEYGHHSPTMSENASNLPSLDLTLDYESAHPETLEESPSLEMNNNVMYNNIPPLVPMLYPAFIPVPYQFCHTSLRMPASEETSGKTHEVLRPKPILLKDSIHADELVGLSKLSLGEASSNRLEPSALSSKLLDSSSRQSAFHSKPASTSSEISQSNSTNAIHAL